MLNGFMRVKGQLQFYELDNFGNLNISFNRYFLNQKLIATLSANDILRTNRNTFYLSQGGIETTGSRQSDTRRLSLNVRYNFGLRKKKDDGGNIIDMEHLERQSN